VNYDEMTREELIKYINDLEKRKVFTYEDELKLIILDKSPFTIWASDRDCRVTLWSGQCETIYGYNSEYVIGRDYIPLFVAPDEQRAARRDQLSIIDDAAVFHNIANDIGKNGNTLQLITNCFRIKDPRSGEYWNAEMGLIIDYIDQEKERLNLIVAESRKVKSYNDQFIERMQQYKVQFQARKKAIKKAIFESQSKAISMGKHNTFKIKVTPIKKALDIFQQTLDQVIEDYYEKLQSCATSNGCKEVNLDFTKSYDDMMEKFEEIVLDFEEFNHEFENDGTFIYIKNAIIKDLSIRNTKLANLAFELSIKANDEIIEYRKIGDISPDSVRLKQLTKQRDVVYSLKRKIGEFADTIFTKISTVNDCKKLNEIKEEMNCNYDQLEKKLIDKKNKLGM
jgi:PAS domain S-box-containing protein